MASTNGDRTYPLYSSENGKKAVKSPKRPSYQAAETTFEIEKRVVNGSGGWSYDGKVDSGIVAVVKDAMKFSSSFNQRNNEKGRKAYLSNSFKHDYKRAA